MYLSIRKIVNLAELSFFKVKKNIFVTNPFFKPIIISSKKYSVTMNDKVAVNYIRKT